MSHGRIICRKCAVLVAQCRCIESHRTMRFSLCKKCQAERPLPDNEYKCAVCLRIFTKARSDAEALAEMRARFGDLGEEDRAVVCEDCKQVLDLLELESEQSVPS